MQKILLETQLHAWGTGDRLSEHIINSDRASQRLRETHLKRYKTTAQLVPSEC